MTRPLIPTIWKTEYACSSCEYRGRVQFVDPEAFGNNEPVAGKDDWAQQEALQEAQVRLEKRGRRALRLVCCPACHRRDAQGVKRAYLWAALPLLGAAPAAFMISIIIASQLWPGRTSMRGPGLGAALVSLLVSAVIVLRGHRLLVREAETAVRFGERTDASG
jgi:hypothetical protein